MGLLYEFEGHEGSEKRSALSRLKVKLALFRTF